MSGQNVLLVGGGVLELANAVIANQLGEFPRDAASDHRRRLRELLERKLRDGEFVRAEPVDGAPVIDLMDALRRSVEQARGDV